jgi:hypothetical protein
VDRVTKYVMHAIGEICKNKYHGSPPRMKEQVNYELKIHGTSRYSAEIASDPKRLKTEWANCQIVLFGLPLVLGQGCLLL